MDCDARRADGALTDPSGRYLLRDLTRDAVVADSVSVAASFSARSRGLIGRDGLAEGEALYLPTSSIHMLFMRFPIDALFLGPAGADGGRAVVALREWLRPWRGIVLPVRGAEGVVELPAGSLRRHGLGVGDQLRLERAG